MFVSKQFIIFYLLIACVSASYLQNEKLLSQNDRDFGNVNCGSFLSECWNQHKVFLKLEGFIDGLPLDVSVEHSNFGDDKCANGETSHVTITGYVKTQFSGNTTHIYGDIIYESAFIVFLSQNMISSWKCLTPIEINKNYNVMDVNCTDSTGADPMAGYKKVQGLVETIDLTFTKDYLMHANHPFYRLSYDGCFYSPEFRNIIGVLFGVVILFLIIGGICISKATKKHAAKKKAVKDKERLLFS